MASGGWASLAAAGCLMLAALAYHRHRPLSAWLAATGTAILVGALVARGLLAGHWPLTSEFEFALLLALSISLTALAIDLKQSDTPAAVTATSLALTAALILVARLLMPGFRQTIQPLPPALDSIWLPLHVSTAALAYGALTVGGVSAALWLAHPPERTATERTTEQAITIGYPLLTLSMILGMIWAEVAWGSYWSWDLKEVWTLILWLIYTLRWHLRKQPAWEGRRLAWLAVVGLVAVFFTFLGVGWLARVVGLESLHLY